MLFFFLYYLIGSTSKLLIIVLLSADVSDQLAVTWVARYLISCFFIIMILLISIYFLDKKTIAFITKIRLKPKQIIIILITIFILGLGDTCLYVIVKKMMELNFGLRGTLNNYYRYFQYSFPLMLGLIFGFIYFKYYKRAKFPYWKPLWYFPQWISYTTKFIKRSCYNA